MKKTDKSLNKLNYFESFSFFYFSFLVFFFFEKELKWTETYLSFTKMA